MMNKQAFIFPGQGSQYVGMGAELYYSFKSAKDIFERANEALSFNLYKLMTLGEAETLNLTQNAQPALMVLSAAILEVLKVEAKFDIKDKVSYLAGHSLGEYSALYASGVFSLEDCVLLLRARGIAMQRAVPPGFGAMAALIGAEIEAVRKLCKEASSNDIFCVVANDNSQIQIVISGHTQAVERAILLSSKFGVKKAVLLPVSAPSHSPLMVKASEDMALELQKIKLNDTLIPVVMNITGKETSSIKEIERLLLAQLTGMVKWRELILYISGKGVNNFIEVGAGKVLTGLVKRIVPEAQLFNLEKPQDIEEFTKNV